MKKYYCGIKEIQYIDNGCWSDPTLIYKDQEISWLHLEDALYTDFIEAGGTDGDFEAFVEYVKLNKDFVLETAEYLFEHKIA